LEATVGSLLNTRRLAQSPRGRCERPVATHGAWRRCGSSNRARGETLGEAAVSGRCRAQSPWKDRSQDAGNGVPAIRTRRRSKALKVNALDAVSLNGATGNGCSGRLTKTDLPGPLRRSGRRSGGHALASAGAGPFVSSLGFPLGLRAGTGARPSVGKGHPRPLRRHRERDGARTAGLPAAPR